jgi:hypothetical protein
MRNGEKISTRNGSLLKALQTSCETLNDFHSIRNIKQSLHKHRTGIGVQIENASGEHCLR